MTGYSGTPLADKLGIGPGDRVLLSAPPPGFRQILGLLPEGAEVLTRAPTAKAKPADVALMFARKRMDLERRFPRLVAVLAKDGGLWVAWPKQSAGQATDLTFDVVQRIGLDAGLVDNKVCAVDETWSGLRFVYRLKDR